MFNKNVKSSTVDWSYSEYLQEGLIKLDVKYHAKRSLKLPKAENSTHANALIQKIEMYLEDFDAKIEPGNTILDTILTQYRL